MYKNIQTFFQTGISIRSLSSLIAFWENKMSVLEWPALCRSLSPMKATKHEVAPGPELKGWREGGIWTVSGHKASLVLTVLVNAGSLRTLVLRASGWDPSEVEPRGPHKAVSKTPSPSPVRTPGKDLLAKFPSPDGPTTSSHGCKVFPNVKQTSSLWNKDLHSSPRIAPTNNLQRERLAHKDTKHLEQESAETTNRFKRI